MEGLWNKVGIPHKGWVLVDVIDIREDWEDEDEVNYEECMMCGRDRIRYVHVVEHEYVHEQYRVGCTCAENMTDDYVNPKQREHELINRGVRRKTWLNRVWKISKNGNHYLNVDKHNLVIYRNHETGKYKVKIDETFGKKSFDNLDLAKIAAFKGMEYLKIQGLW